MKKPLEKCTGDCFHCTLPDCHSSTYPPYRRTPFEREQSALRHEKVLRARRAAAHRRAVEKAFVRWKRRNGIKGYKRGKGK